MSKERWFDFILEKHCQSPIESRLAASLFEHFDRLIGTQVLGGDLSLFDLQPTIQKYTLLHYATTVSISIQQPIGPYKADMAIGVIGYHVDEQSGHGPEVLKKFPVVVIECDGHDFHERTKEQAQHDKARDRYMAVEGYRVLRFTGSEIHKSAESCVKQIVEFLRSLGVQNIEPDYFK